MSQLTLGNEKLMSLTVSLKDYPIHVLEGPALDFLTENGWQLPDIFAESEYVFDKNITHNLGRMAAEADLYAAMWEPEKKGWTRAGQIIPALEAGLAKLLADPDKYRQFNPINKWGRYESLVAFVEEYLAHCNIHPNAVITVSR